MTGDGGSPGEAAALESLLAVIGARHNVAPKRLVEPGPGEAELARLFEAAAAAPDHGQVLPWRFVMIPGDKRGLLAEAFVKALIDRDAGASAEQIEAAREKAFRSPLLMLAIVKLTAHRFDQIADGERFISLGCAIQNILLASQAMGYGTGLASGRALAAEPLRHLFSLGADEQAVCFINIGTPTALKPPLGRPPLSRFVGSL